MRKIFFAGATMLFLTTCTKSPQPEWGHQNELDSAMLKHWISLNSSQEAVDVFKRLHEKGDVLSTRYYAHYLAKGMYVPQDRVRADELFNAVFPQIRALALKGDARAQFVIGSMYGHGEVGPANKTEEYQWYLKAAGNGYPPACHNLGEMTLSGTGVAKDPQKAFEWFSQAAEQGFPLSEYYLGWIYSVGKGRPRDFKKAQEWYIKSAEHGFLVAQKELGDMYSAGLAGEQSYSKAYEWYLKAAKGGSAEAQFAVAEMLYRGNGVQRDPVSAKEWLSKIDDSNATGIRGKVTSLRKEIEESGISAGNAAKNSVVRRLVLNTKLLAPPIAVSVSVSDDEKYAAVLGWPSSKEWFDNRGVVGLLNLANGTFTALQVITDYGLPIGEMKVSHDNRAVTYVNYKDARSEKWRCDVESKKAVSEGFIKSVMGPVNIDPNTGLVNQGKEYSLVGFPATINNSAVNDDNVSKYIYSFGDNKYIESMFPGALQWISDNKVLSLTIAGNGLELIEYEIPGGKAVERYRMEIADYKDYPTIGAAFVVLPEYNDALLVVQKSFCFEDYEGWGTKKSDKGGAYQLYRVDISAKQFDLIAEIPGDTASPPIPKVSLYRRPGHDQVLVAMGEGSVLLADLRTKTISKLAMNIVNPMALDAIRNGTYSSRMPVFDFPAARSYYWFKDGKHLLINSDGVFIAEID